MPSYTYQWRRCNSAGTSCADIAGETASTYTLVSGDVGSTIRVAVNDGVTTVTSSPTAVITAAAPPAPGADWAWDATAASLDANSSTRMATWRSYAIVNPNFAAVTWGVATAEAKSGDPTYTISLLKQGGSLSIRCPLGVRPAKPYYVAPSGSGDSHLTIRDMDAGTETDFWQAEYDSGTNRIKQASAAVTFPIDSVTAITTGWAGDAANMPLRRGLVTREEVVAGVINHPLVFGCPQIGTGSPRFPAIHNAPTSSSSTHLVEGSWLRLPAAYDTSGLTGLVKALADAAKAYGMFLRDNSGSLVIYGEDPINRGGSWPYTINPSLSAFPWSSLELLEPPTP